MLPGIIPPTNKPIMRVTAAKALLMLGMTAVLCLDAGDSASYDGSSQTWTDVSGSGNHFYRGTTSGSDSTDPTFNGVAGRLSKDDYFSFDGGDFFTPTGAWTFDDGLHHDNADFAILAVFYTTTLAVTHAIFGNSNSSIAEGIMFYVNTGNSASFQAKNGTGTASALSTGVLTSGTWSYVVASVNEAAGANGSFMRMNRTTTLKDGTYTTPGSGNGNDAPQIGARGGTTTTSALSNGDRLAMFIVFGAHRTTGQIAAFHSLMQGRFLF